MRHRLKYVCIPPEEDAEFVHGLGDPPLDYSALMKQSLTPVLREYGDAIEVLDRVTLPDGVFAEEVERIRGKCLLVNICSPTAMIGGGHVAGDTLDGCFGMCSAITVLCWPQTNPFLQWDSVDPVL